MKSKSTILIIILLAALFSGCVGGPQTTPAPTPQPTTATPSETATTSPSATPLPEVTVSQTPTPQTTQRESPPLYVATQNIAPVFVEPGNYSLQGISAYITNEQTNPLFITAQIVSNGQILYEKSFVLDHMGSSYGFTDSEQHYITSTNVTLRLQVQGYQPAEYTFKVAGNG
jgi:PBP1b-binding outer membrane lipoprotein LpoB